MNSTGLLNPIQDWLYTCQRLIQSTNSLFSFGVLLDKNLEFAAGEELCSIEKNTDTKFDILLSASRVEEAKRTDRLLKTCEFRNRLAGQPSGIVTGNFLQCVLTLNDQIGDVGGRQDETTDYNGKRQFERA